MDNTVSVSRITATILALSLLAGLRIAAAQTVGRTKGTFAVSPDGAATYTIPIFAPRGPSGLQPNIALAYNSQSGNGYVGVGWSVAGLSSIYRCNQTSAQDAAAGPITLTSSDVFCLDGQRLRLTYGTYGAAGSTYQTEIANFSNVTAEGTSGNGPAYFTVQAANGLTYEYGNGGNSGVLASGTSTVLTWMLDKVTDRAGNTMTFSYETLTGTVVPETISWTPTSYGSSQYGYTMQFSYTTNAVGTAGYVAGTPVQNPNLLTSITIDYSGSQVKEYELSYQTSGTTGRDRLTTVTECATTSNCLYPTTITYQNGSAGVSTSATVAISSPLTSPWGMFAAHYDFNGDGYDDLIYEIGSTWYVQFGSANGYGSPVNTGLTGTFQYNLLFGDLLGTGKAGILADENGTWYYYQWNGSSFTGTSTGLAYSAAQYALADINGDGLPDLVALYQPSPVTVTTRLNTSSGSTPSFSSSAVTAYSGGNVQVAVLLAPDNAPGNLSSFDFNGDGRQDLALFTYYCAYYYMGACLAYVGTVNELISQTGGTFSAVNIADFSGTSYIGNVSFANVNNDDCTDAIIDQRTVLDACSSDAQFTAAYPVVAVMDWNGDGLADLIENNNGTLYVQPSTATSFGTAEATSLAYNSDCTYIALDANGDGLDDLGCVSTTSGTNGFEYYLHNGAGQPPDLMSNVTDGYGNSASPTYVSMVQSQGSTYFEWNNAQYPYENYLGPMYLVNQVTFSDPSNAPTGTYQQAYYYAGAWQNLQGRGFAGFGNVQMSDSRSGLWKTWGYGLPFPYTGMFTSFLETQNNSSNEAVAELQDTTAVTVLDSTAYEQRYFPYVASQVLNRYQVGGAQNGALISMASTSYTYDDYGNATNVAKTVTDEDGSSPYYGQSWTTTTTNTPDPNASTWCLRLLSEAQVAYSASSGSPVTRTKQFTPDTTNCRYTQVVTQPSSAYQVTEAYGYDSFGNINSDTVTGANMASRQTQANWGATGQFPLSVTDPSGATTNFNYNFSFGRVSSTTDPNNLTTSWQYDGFGRKQSETRPDGTYTVWTRDTCGELNQCWNANLVPIVGQAVYAVGGALIHDTSYYYDRVGRILFKADRMLDGGYSLQETQYDSLGRVHQQSAPCVYGSCTDYWTAYSYDALNRPLQIQRPISSTDSTLQTTTYTYSGPTTTVTDPQGNTKTVVTDVNGWLRKATDAYGYTVTLGYDAAGSHTSTTDSLGNTLWTGTYAYGIKPFLIGFADADRGDWGAAVDALGERTAWTDAKGQQFSMTYDALSRPLTRSEPDLYTQWTWGSSASSDNVGKLQSVCTGTGTNPTNCTTSPGYSEQETYDSVGRHSTRAITLPSTGTYTYTWQYDPNTGLLSSLTFPVSASGYAFELQYGYQYGVLQSITDVSDSPNVTVWQANASNPAGQVTQETLGNGIVTNWAYDAVTHWLSSVQSGENGGSGAKNLAFLYDEMGNVTQRQDNNLGLTENVYYDDDYRFSYSQLNGTQNLSMTYDAMGDITSRSDVASGASWTYDTTHLHAVDQAGSGAYAYGPYDANGNPSSARGDTFGWSSYNYPTYISASTGEELAFSYGPDRQRWQQVYEDADGDIETTDYIGKLMERVSDSDGSVTYRHYIYAGSEPVAVYARTSSGGTLNYFLTDQEGSLSAITNSSGQTVVNESYTAFGDRRNPSTWSGAASGSDLTASEAITRQGYTFQTLLGEDLGFNHMNGRVQDAIIGRFLSADPKIPDPTDPQSYNRYSYTRNNPLTSADPSGFDDVPYPEDGCQSASPGAPCAPAPDVGTGCSTGTQVQGVQCDADGVDPGLATAFDNFLAQSGATPSLNLSVDDPLSSLDSPLPQSQSSGFWSTVGSFLSAVSAQSPLMTAVMIGAVILQPEGPGEALDLGILAGEGVEAAEGAAIETPYALEVQSASAEAQAALTQAQNGATLYRTGTLGSNMAGESQYWSLENPLTSPGYAGQMGVPGGTPNFVLQGTLNPGASVITNVAPGLGLNAGGGIQIVTSPGGVGNLIFTMPY